MKMFNDPVMYSWMYEMGLSGDDAVIFAFINSNPRTDVDIIACFMHKRRDSVQRNIDRLISKSHIVDNRHKLCVAPHIQIEHEPKDLSNGFDLVKKPKKNTIIEMRNTIKGKIENFVMYNCNNDQELLDQLLKYLSIVGVSKKSLNEYTWQQRLDNFDADIPDISDKIQSVKEAIAATPVYQNFYPPKKKQTARPITEIEDNTEYDASKAVWR